LKLQGIKIKTSGVIMSYYNYTNESTAALTALAQKRQQQKHQQQLIQNQTKSAANAISANQSKAASLAEARAQAIAAANSINAQILQQQSQFCFTNPSGGSFNNTIHVTTTYNSSGQATSTTTTLNDQVTIVKQQNNAEKEAEQKRLEEEMKKRRERIEKWRKEKNKNGKDGQPATGSTANVAGTGSVGAVPSANKKSKQWNLEDDDEDEEHQQQLQQQEAKNNSSFQFLNQQTTTTSITNDESANPTTVNTVTTAAPVVSSNDLKRKIVDEDEDPLDAYMKEIYKKTPKLAKPGAIKSAVSSSEPATKKVTIVMAVAKTADASKQKGQIMEQDIDGLEYELSDDDEESTAAGSGTALNSESLLDPSSMMAKGQKSKSEMVFTDHSKVYYRPFKKNFYVEVPEIAKMIPAEVELLREELEG